jgi:hypothetical protein
MSVPKSPRDSVEEWVRLNQHRIGTLTKLKRVEEPSFCINAWFETSNYIIDICAWDNAFCLDIEALNIATEKTDFCVAGPCENGKALIHRLEMFLQWIESKKA